MKLFTFAFVIASVLEDYGTFQVKPIEDCSPDELIEQFEKYALKLVDAAVQRFRENQVLMQGGSDCFTGIDAYKDLNPLDAVLATMSIAKDHYEAFQAMRKTSGLVQNVRLILAVLHSSPEMVKQFFRFVATEKYVFNKKRDSSNTESDLVESAVKCYRSLACMFHGNNGQFFEELITGFKIENALMRDDDQDFKDDSIIKERQARLDTIVERISKHQLSVPGDDYGTGNIDDVRAFLIEKNLNNVVL